jgi:hypothetical protein
MNSPEASPGASALIAASERTAPRSAELAKRLPELIELEQLLEQHRQHLDLRTEYTLEHSLKGDHDQAAHKLLLPLYSIRLGSLDPQAPTLLLTGGMHGIERIGTQVLIAWLQTLLERLRWDSHLQQLLSQVQLVLMPILNPVGMYLNQRANGNGVDLNRNAPIDAEGAVPLLGGGHRLGPFLPWYRGRARGVMEAENLALERVIARWVINRPFAAVVDLHSGLGMRDRLWFPHAYRKKPIGNIAEYLALKLLWERSYPHHTYLFEPQSLHYLTHGDLWDYFYYQSRAHNQPHFLPLTLEMGSWLWVKKSPRQLLNMAGLFNPQTQHRHTRVLRRHLTLLDFMLAACLNHAAWLPDKTQTELLRQSAHCLWFQQRS